MAVTGISNGTVLLNLNNATNYVYEVFSTTDLTQPWNIETEVFPGTNTSAMPFTVNQEARGSLFLWARDWTGITSNGNQTPSWWFWYWFGELGLSDTNLDSQGNTLLSDYQRGANPNVITFSLSVTNQYVNNSNIPIQINVTGGAPCYMAVLVDDTNWADANWIPYASTPLVPLGTNEGWHQIWLNLRGFPTDSQSAWAWYRVKLDTTPPLLVITNPASTNVMQPMIQVQGLCPESLASLTYDLSNAAGLSTNLQAFVLDQYYSTNTWESTTNTFQAFDVPLANGANVLTFHATDLAGNITTTNFTYTLSYASRTNPPVVQLYWPQDGTQISGSNFTMRGCLDDFTTAIQATIIDSNGDTNTVSAIVERNGNFWIDNLPLAAGANEVILTATDVASNVAVTNITVTGSSLVLTMNPINSSQLWQVTENLSGTISDPTMSVWVNGVEGANNGDGTWDASGVLTTAGGTVVFQVRAIPNSGNDANDLGGGGMASYASMADSSSASATDVEISEDRPARLYIAKYTFSLTNNPSDASESDIGTWSDGTGGSETYSQIGFGTCATSCCYQYVYPASYWPNAAWGIGSVTASNGCGWTLSGETTWPPCIYWDHCEINDATTYSGILGDCYACWFGPIISCVRQSQCIMQFDAYGGRGVPGAKTLVQFTCSAGDGLSTKPILPQSITMGNLGSLDARGNLYVALPSGVTTVVTPQTPGRQWYKFSPTATPIPVTLTANGYDLSQTTPTFCVGQHIAFNLSCPGLPMTNVSCNWTLGGNFVNAASPPNSVGCVTYTKDSSLLQGPHTSCQGWYVNGGSATVNVGANIIVGAKSLSTAAMGTFSIYRPTAKMVKIEEPRHFTVTNNTGITSKLQLGDAAGNGCMYYQVEVDSTPPNANPHFYGQADITQLVTLDYSNPAFVCSGYCDGPEFYMLNPQRVVGVGLVSLADGPAEIWDSPNIVNISAQDFIRFQPDGAYSIWVTLGIVTWDAVGTSEQGLGLGWTLTTDVSPDPTGPDSSGAFPVWTASIGAH